METLRQVGRYRIDEWLASGAMGEVYRAFDPILDRPVAIKLVRRELIAGDAAQPWVERFRREARAAGRRFHPNIIAVLDFGEEPQQPFLVMEYVEGRSLDALLKESGPLPSERAATLTVQVLSALGFSHQHGVIHRDVKPANVMVEPGDRVKVADFGIARFDASDLTLAGDIIGTPAYMAPEQLSGLPVDHRADLFAVGVLLFEMLTREKPFRGKSITDIIKQMETRGPEDVCALNPSVPSSLRGVIATALAFDQDARYATADAFAQGIAEAMANREDPDTVLWVPPALAQGQVAGDATGPVWEPEELRQVEARLMPLIGPVAGVAVRRAARRTGDLLQLYEILAAYIDDARDRTHFLQAGRAAAAERPRRATGERPSPAETRTRPLAGDAGGSTGEMPDPAALGRIEAQLAVHLGPIARILVRQQAQRYAGWPQLCLALAAHIQDEGERHRFLAVVRAE